MPELDDAARRDTKSLLSALKPLPTQFADLCAALKQLASSSHIAPEDLDLAQAAIHEVKAAQARVMPIANRVERAIRAAQKKPQR